MKIIVATMVKDEDDIIRDWIEYYGTLFSFENIYIIDNMSTDNTFKICQEYVKKGLHLERKPDYKKKGEYMTHYKNTIPCDIFIPVDIDEFIIYLNKKDKKVEYEKTLPYLKNIKTKFPNKTLFKMPYVMPIRTNNKERLLKQFTHGSANNICNMSKTLLVNSADFKKINIDHGNHINTNNFQETELCLVHFHRRLNEHMRKKIINNVLGLGYKMDIEFLTNLLIKNPKTGGFHHVKHALDLLKNPNKDLGHSLQQPNQNHISLKELLEKMK
jgi:hypothetical protein